MQNILLVFAKYGLVHFRFPIEFVVLDYGSQRRRIMSKKSGTKKPKVGSAKASPRKTLTSIKTNSPGVVIRNATSGKFVSARTGRIVKSSLAEPNLSRELIRSAVNTYVNRDPRP